MLDAMQLRDGPMSSSPQPEPGPAEWRVARDRPMLTFAGAVVFVLVGLFFGAGDPIRLWVALAAAAGLVAFAVRDLVAPVRLAADHEGVTLVVGFARRLRVPWSEIARVRVDARRRFGVRTELLEIDTGETLHFLSAKELGMPVPDVVSRLGALRAGLT